MLFLITGASGAGKSMVRDLVSPQLGSTFEAVELKDLGPVEGMTVARRQEMAELAAARAAELTAAGRHLLLSGDPVAAGEVIAAPSAMRCGGVAVCLLDVSESAQRSRLGTRGDPSDLIPLCVAHAQWMREHARDPTSRIEALTHDSADGMQWDRLTAALAGTDRWRVRVVDTSATSPADVAAKVRQWVEAAQVDDSLVMRPERWDVPG